MKKIPWFWIIAAAAWLCFIWWHSLQPASVSSQQSGAVLEGLSALFSALHLPNVLDMHLVRKLAHGTEYAVLGLLLAGGLGDWKAVWPARLWGALSGCLAAAVIDETIQLFVEGRSGQISDLWVDLAGGLVGIAAAMAVIHLRKKHR